MSVLGEQIAIAKTVDTLGIEGQVAAMSGMTIHARGLRAPIGSLCHIAVGADRHIPAEIIGFRKDAALLMPLDEGRGISSGQRIRYTTASQRVPVGHSLLGRVINAMGEPCDDKGPLSVDTYYPIHRAAPDAMNRPRIDQPLSVGVRAINSMLTVGGGQRLGVFAGTGVGKSVLLGMMARYTAADVTVIGLIGERGRELVDFIHKDLGEEGLKRSVLVVSTSDQSPPLRLRAGFTATAVAEYFRDQGANVLLLMDSVTRMAMAARQIGLAAGEPPTTKGYPPSVFAMLPRMLERCGRTERGTITGLYTVLVEADDLNDPIGDAVRGILDGHIWLSRKLANRAHYPAIAILDSISRVMPDIIDAAHLQAVQKVKRTMAVWEEIEDLVNIGAYATGANQEFDVTIKMRPAIETFLRQDVGEKMDFAQSRDAILALSAAISKAETEVKPATKAPTPNTRKN